VTTTSVLVQRSIGSVFDAVVDPESYPSWLVGARTIRGVDPDWPAVGSSFRHVIGVPPLLVPGSSTVRLVRRPTEFVLGAGMGPLGEAVVHFRLSERASGSTSVEVDERFVAGPAGWSWRWARPVVGGLVWGRNAVSLEALRSRLEDGTGEPAGS
jgi:uncharacterized protein YndB with AHSA1/START domain